PRARTKIASIKKYRGFFIAILRRGPSAAERPNSPARRARGVVSPRKPTCPPGQVRRLVRPYRLSPRTLTELTGFIGGDLPDHPTVWPNQKPHTPRGLRVAVANPNHQPTALLTEDTAARSKPRSASSPTPSRSDNGADELATLAS